MIAVSFLDVTFSDLILSLQLLYNMSQSTNRRWTLIQRQLVNLNHCRANQFSSRIARLSRWLLTLLGSPASAVAKVMMMVKSFIGLIALIYSETGSFGVFLASGETDDNLY